MKHIIFFCIFSLGAFHLVAQCKTVRIQGVVQDSTIKSIEISHLVDDKLSKWEDTKADVLNGMFNISIQIPFPIEMTIGYGSKLFRKNYIDNDTKVLIDTAGTLHIIESSIQNEFENEFLPFFKGNDQIYASMQSFYQRNISKYGNEFTGIIKDSAILYREKYYTQRAQLLSEYVKRKPNSFVALWNIYYYVTFTPAHQYFDFETILSAFSKQMQIHPFMVAIKAKISESAKVQVGQLFPKRFFIGYEQLQRNVEKYNRYYLIDFWFSHCGPCIAGFPKLKEIYKEFHHKGFEIVSISVDRQSLKSEYEAAIKKNNLLWKHVWDKDGVTSQAFNITTFPTYILLDKNGLIINSQILTDELEVFLRANL